MSEILFEVLLINLLIILNGIFSMSELAVVSSRKARLQQKASGGSISAQAALELANNPASFFSTVQVGITLVGILAGAFGGASISRQLAAALAEFPAISAYSSQIAFFIVVAAITCLSLIIGELVPKRVALANPEKIASIIAAPMKFLSRAAAPVVWFLDTSSDLVVRIMGIKPGSEPSITEEEIKILVTQAADAGVVARTEQDIVHNVFTFADQRVSRLMTHRNDIRWLDMTKTDEENWALISNSRHTYFPVCDGALDRMVGVLSVKQLWSLQLTQRSAEWKQNLSQPLYVPTNMTGLKLLELFKQTRKHFALVVNEYGSIQGVVTIQDVLEALVGEMTPDIEGEQAIVKRQDGSWLLDGLVGIDKFKEVFKLSSLPNEASGGFETVGGFVMHSMGRIPKPADRFEAAGYRFEVVDMDGNRVDKIMVTPLKR